MPAVSSNVLKWEEVCADRSLRHLPYKVETTGGGKLLLTKLTVQRSYQQADIMVRLSHLMPHGKVRASSPIETSDGTRVADACWISRERWLPQRKQWSATTAPEICVELLSDFNCREYALSKLPLYFERDALETWLCDEEGAVEFYSRDAMTKAMPNSRLCPEFPTRIETE